MTTLTVTTLIDEAFDGGETVGSPDGAGLSLREALALAQDNDTITFAGGLSGGTIMLGGSQLVITQDDLIIDGDLDNDGDADITVSGNNASRVFELMAGSEADANDVSIDGLNIIDGLVEGNGGGIYANLDTTLLIYSSTFTGNEAGSGGAIASRGELFVADSQISGNIAAYSGGGIAHFGDNAITTGNNLAIISSTISDNMASNFGGGVFGTGFTSSIYNSTVSGNSTTLNNGGGAYFGLGANYANIVNSTFYSNSAAQSGGGLSANTIDTEIINSTFTGNSAVNSGGGVRNLGLMAIGNSIIAGNWVSGAGTTDEIESASGDFYDGVNIFGNQEGGIGDGDDILVFDLTTVFASTVNEGGNIFGVLADNGGPVQTVAISSTGVAVNAGDDSILPPDRFNLDDDANTTEPLPVDARDATRVVGSEIDIGAFEIGDIIGTEGPDSLPGTSGDDNMFGLGGADNISGLGGSDTISGGAGDDTLDGGAGDDTIGGEAGRDSILGGDGADTLHGFGSHDSLLGGNGNDDLRGGFGRDLLNGSSGNDILRGFEGDDRLFGGGGADTLLGNDGNDSLTGGGGVDRLKGDAGDDTLNGRFGDDLVTGGAGDDLFEFRQSHGNDTYDDFVAGAGTDDAIELIAFGTAFDTFAEVIAAASDNGNHTTIDFGGGDSILLLNVVVGDLHEDDFLFS